MIELKNINKSFYSKKKEQKIFNNASISFDNVGLTAIVAPSGTGKTTLFNMICCFDKKYDGTIDLDGNLMTDELVKKNISYLMQEDNLFNNISVLDNLMIYDEVEEKDIDNLLKEFDIIDLKDKNVSNLSGGQRRRVALVRALLKKPKVLICDEPTSSLDKSNSIVVMDILKKISRDILVIYSSHDDELVDEYSDSIYLVSNNTIICKKNNSINKIVNVSNDTFTISKKYKKNIINNITFSNSKIAILSIFTLILVFVTLLFCFSILKYDVVHVQVDTMKQENDYTLVFYDSTNVGSCHVYKRSNDDYLRLNDNNLEKENYYYSSNDPIYYALPVWYYFYQYDDSIDYGKYIGNVPSSKNEIMIYQIAAERLLNDGIIQADGSKIKYDKIDDLLGKNIISGESVFTITGIIIQDLSIFEYLKTESYKVYDIDKFYRQAYYFYGKYSFYSAHVLTTFETIIELNNNYNEYALNAYPSFIKYDNYQDIEKVIRNIDYEDTAIIRDYYNLYGTHYSDAIEDFSFSIYMAKYIIRYCIPIIIMIVLLISYLLTRNNLEKNSKNIALMKMSGFSKKDIISSFSVSMIIYYLLSFVISSGLFIIVTRILCSYFTKLYYFYFDPFYLEISYFIYLLITFVVLSLISYFMINRFYNKMNTVKLTRNN